MTMNRGKYYYSLRGGLGKILDASVFITEKYIDSLIGSPEIVTGVFNCCDTNLSSLLYSPKIVGGYFSCAKNKLSSLYNGPLKVGEELCCIHNNLTSLDFLPLTFWSTEF